MTYAFHIAGLNCILETPLPHRFHNCLKAFRMEEIPRRWDVRWTVKAQDYSHLPEETATCIFSDYRMDVYRESVGDIRYYTGWSAHRRSLENPVLRETAPNDYLLSVPEERLALLADHADFTNFLGIETVLSRFHRFLLHSSVVIWQGKAVLFSAPSGVGKSTHADLWQKHFGAKIPNGDRCVVEVRESRSIAHGSPFAGSSAIFKRESAPIAAIFLLEQAPVNEVLPVSPLVAVQALLQESVIGLYDEKQTEATFDLLLKLAEQVPVRRLRCRPDREAAELAKSAVFNRKD